MPAGTIPLTASPPALEETMDGSFSFYQLVLTGLEQKGIPEIPCDCALGLHQDDLPHFDARWILVRLEILPSPRRRLRLQKALWTSFFRGSRLDDLGCSWRNVISPARFRCAWSAGFV